MQKYAEKAVSNSTREKHGRHHTQQPAIKDNLDRCVNDIKKGKMTIGKIDNVPKIALHDCISSGLPHWTIFGSG